MKIFAVRPLNLFGAILLAASLISCMEKEDKNTPPDSDIPPDSTKVIGESKPATPEKPTLTPFSKAIKVVWKEVEGAEEYIILVGTDEKELKPKETVKTGTLEKTIADLENGKDYFIAIVAKNAQGESDPSEVASAKPEESKGPGPAEVKSKPAKPEKPKLAPESRKIKVSWKEVADAEEYIVLSGTARDDLKALDPVAKGTLEKTIEDLENGKEYFIALKAKNAQGESEPSEIASATPKEQSPPPPTPEKPVPFNASELSGSFDTLFQTSNSVGQKAMKNDAAVKKTITSGFRAIAEKVKSLDLSSFSAMQKDDRAALLVNLHNAVAISWLSEDPDPAKEYRENKALKSNAEKYKAFFNGSFFTKESIGFADMPGISLNDIVYGILIGDDDYLKNSKNKDILKKYNGALGFDEGGAADPSLLFLLICGYPVLPTIRQITETLGLNGSITGSDLARIEASGSLDRLISKFLTDDSYGFGFRTELSGWFDLWGDIENMPSVKLPYIMKAYEKAIKAKYQGDTYFEKFLIDHLPESDEKTYLSNNISADKKCIQVDFHTDLDLLKVK